MINGKYVIAVIPARGGSKRLPGKNTKLLAGKPLIRWTTQAAVASGEFDMVIVSTDSQAIADIAIQDSGVIFPGLRPIELASDTATTNDVISHVVQWVEDNYSMVGIVAILQPTSPFRTAQHIKEAMALYKEKKATAVVSVCELDHPIQYCNRLPSDNSLNGFITPLVNKRSQELQPFYRLNGAIYLFDRQHVGDLSGIYCESSYAYLMDKKSSVDIDDEFDFLLAEAIEHHI
ncbi:acylneuraminate cytidylyltransferase family protein [Vibrio metschnikovii]|uniref:Acylneuraminate cytidylyltransferase family protein n=1 Tax=bacterium 19PA01SH03 TaxID=2920705 RepID=A0AAU6SNC2_UNCXX|nr:acylneuraminate cytidylyltransferase family protein [Vibrio metschnikovii]EKO3663871.1 acylneuraminate cytidylyltransferase family protein [Vibrio metschnikovii]EKO3733339.1 acylneuraminate cytidylyltransferase family protein [Vibrio metschnikovii]EKO3753697.1 acylneuraminate cytidylyltransferase family protein [Vibrio metschnikovii]EKO3902324.1 acylneuraminate cytidylyltransferase family protein [Vibrio metschnikovii]